MNCSACGTENRPGRRPAATAQELNEIEAQFNLAQTLLDHAELLSGAGRDDEATPLVAQARTIFERLGAKPWLERANALRPAVAA